MGMGMRELPTIINRRAERYCRGGIEDNLTDTAGPESGPGAPTTATLGDRNRSSTAYETLIGLFGL